MTTPALPEFSDGYVYPDNDSVPEYLRGKSVEEATQLLQAHMEQAPTPQPPPAPPVAPAPPANDYVRAEEFRAAQQAVLAQLARVADESAAQLVERAKREHGDVFRRYGGEVSEVLQAVPRAQWTSSVVENAVTFVRGRHFNELSAERASASSPMYGSAMRSTGGAAPMISTPLKKPEAGLERWQDRAARAGIGPREIEEFARSNDMTPDEFFEQFGNGIISDACADIGSGKRNGTS